MADNPFSGLGLGMLGQDVGLARQMSTPDSFQEKMAKAAAGGASPLAILANKAFESIANAFPDASKAVSGIQGAVMPTGQVSPSPVAPATPSGPVAPVLPAVGTAPAATDATTSDQYSIGGYRKFLRPQGFGITPQ